MFKKWKNGIRKTLLGIFVVATLMTAEVAAQAQSLTLEQCIDTALQYNRSYRMSQQDAGMAEEKLKEVKSSLIKHGCSTAVGAGYYTLADPQVKCYG